MPWNEEYYPPAMQQLPSIIRAKAIEIANALLEEGHDEGFCIRVAICRLNNRGRRRTIPDRDFYVFDLQGAQTVGDSPQVVFGLFHGLNLRLCRMAFGGAEEQQLRSRALDSSIAVRRAASASNEPSS